MDIGRGEHQRLSSHRLPEVVMAKKPSVHTTPNPRGAGWVNEVAGEVVSHHRTQDNASEKGRDFAQQLHTEHVIHRPNGVIRDKNSYGNDPLPPRDQR